MFFEDILRVGGFFAVYSLVVALGAVAGVLGVFCAKKIKDFNGDWDWEDKAYFGLFVVFLCLVGIYLFILPIFMAGEIFAGMIGNLLVIVFCSFYSFYVFDVIIIASKKNDLFLVFLFFSTIAGIVLPLIMIIGSDISFYQLNEKQKAKREISRGVLEINSPSYEIKTVIEKAKKYNYLPVSVEGIANLRLGEKNEAIKNFRDHAKRVMGKEYFWLGVADYYEGNFLSASQQFRADGFSDMELISLFRDGNLTLENFSLLIKSGKCGLLSEELLEAIREQLISQEVVSKASETEKLILQKIDQLENSNSEKNKSAPLGERIEAKELEIIINYQRELMSPMPEVASDEEMILSLLPILPLFVFVMFIVIKLTRGFWEKNQNKKQRRWTRWLNKAVGKISWHSFIAKKISVKIALSEKEKGMFSDEIERISEASFPFDAILALLYWRMIKRVVKKWEIQSQEKEDIGYIVQEIRRLAGKLIPLGNQESLAIITALRAKAVQANNKHLKGAISYKKTRDFLLKTMEELITVGDILEARNGENQISYYSLLGIETRCSDAGEIKKAYRSVIAAVHPDAHNGNRYLESLAAIVNVVYSVLGDPLRKEIYDKQMGF